MSEIIGGAGPAWWWGSPPFRHRNVQVRGPSTNARRSRCERTADETPGTVRSDGVGRLGLHRWLTGCSWPVHGSVLAGGFGIAGSEDLAAVEGELAAAIESFLHSLVLGGRLHPAAHFPA